MGPFQHPFLTLSTQKSVKTTRTKHPNQGIGKERGEGQNDLGLFRSARQRAMSIFFAVTRLQLCKQNQIKCIDRSALNKGLLVLKKALGNKIPLNELRDWELPHVIKPFKHTNFLK